MLELPTLYGRARNGSITQWRVYTKGDIVCTEHGKLGGKQSLHQDRVRNTNVGRANARIGESQAEAEAKSAWDKKLKEGYYDSAAKAQTAVVLLPMLAHPLERKAKREGRDVRIERDVDWSHLWIQAKLNGLRCLSMFYQPGLELFKDMVDKPEGSDIVMRSREGEDWTTLSHIKADLTYFMEPGDIVDGEAYQHGLPLQLTNSYVKREQEGTKFISYHLYDFPARRGKLGATWRARLSLLRDTYVRYVLHKAAAAGLNTFVHADIEETLDGLRPDSQLELFISQLPIQLVKTYSVTSRSEARDYQQKFLQLGYEGAILRIDDGQYELGDRSPNLLKMKEFIDSSHQITDVLGRELIKDGTSTWIVDKFVCVMPTPSGPKSFEAVPRGTMAQRAEWWNTRVSLVGQFITVRYLELSVGGLPQGNVVAIGFRLEEDRGPEDEKMW
jgi:hypothetical protein